MTWCFFELTNLVQLSELEGILAYLYSHSLFEDSKVYLQGLAFDLAACQVQK